MALRREISSGEVAVGRESSASSGEPDSPPPARKVSSGEWEAELDDDSPAKGSVSTKLETALIVEISMPAFRCTQLLSFKVKPSSQKTVMDSVDDLVQSIAQDFGSEVALADRDGSEMKMELLRKRAEADMTDWQAKLKMVDEWKMKVDRAAMQMNKMRDAYYKELFHLREQVYQQKKSEKEGVRFAPDYAIHFDPVEYTVDDEVGKLVAEKVSFIEQQMETRIAEMDLSYSTRMKSLSESVKSTKIQLSRTEKLNKKLMEKVGIKNGAEAAASASAEAAADAAEAAAVAKNDAREIKMTKAKSEPPRRGSLQATAASSQEQNEQERFKYFMDHKFGSLKEAELEAKKRRGSDAQEKFSAAGFQTLMKQVGFHCIDPSSTFEELTGGEPAVTVSQLFALAGRKRESRLTDQRRSSHSGAAAAAALTPSPPPQRQNSGGSASSKPRRQISDDDAQSMMQDDFKCEGLSDLSSSSCSESDEDFGSEDGGSKKGIKMCAVKSLPANYHASDAAAKRRGSEPSAVPSEMVQKAGFQIKKKQGKRKDIGVGTTSRFDCGTEAAFSSKDALAAGVKQTHDVGITCSHYHHAYPKAKMVTRGCQAQISHDMIEKAMEFFEQAAADEWNALCNDIGIEVEERRPSHHGTPRLASKDDLTNESTADSTGGTSDAFEDFEALAAAVRTAARSNTFSEFGGRRRLSDVNKEVKENVDTLSTAASSSAIAGRCKRCEDFEFGANGRGNMQVRPRMQDFSIQCQMTRIVVTSPLEMWIPTEADPLEVQLQQLIDVVDEIEGRVPDLRNHAESLLAKMSNTGSVEKVIEQLNRMRFAQVGGVTVNRSLSAEMPRTGTADKRPGTSGGAGGIQAILGRRGHRSQAGSQLQEDTPPLSPMYFQASASPTHSSSVAANVGDILSRHGIAMDTGPGRNSHDPNMDYDEFRRDSERGTEREYSGRHTERHTDRPAMGNYERISRKPPSKARPKAPPLRSMNVSGQMSVSGQLAMESASSLDAKRPAPISVDAKSPTKMVATLSIEGRLSHTPGDDSPPTKNSRQRWSGGSPELATKTPDAKEKGQGRRPSIENQPMERQTSDGLDMIEALPPGWSGLLAEPEWKRREVKTGIVLEPAIDDKKEKAAASKKVSPALSAKQVAGAINMDEQFLPTSGRFTAPMTMVSNQVSGSRDSHRAMPRSARASAPHCITESAEVHQDLDVDLQELKVAHKDFDVMEEWNAPNRSRKSFKKCISRGQIGETQQDPEPGSAKYRKLPKLNHSHRSSMELEETSPTGSGSPESPPNLPVPAKDTSTGSATSSTGLAAGLMHFNPERSTGPAFSPDLKIKRPVPGASAIEFSSDASGSCVMRVASNPAETPAQLKLKRLRSIKADILKNEERLTSRQDDMVSERQTHTGNSSAEAVESISPRREVKGKNNYHKGKSMEDMDAFESPTGYLGNGAVIFNAPSERQTVGHVDGGMVSAAKKSGRHTAGNPTKSVGVADGDKEDVMEAMEHTASLPRKRGGKTPRQAPPLARMGSKRG